MLTWCERCYVNVLLNVDNILPLWMNLDKDLVLAHDLQQRKLCVASSLAVRAIVEPQRTSRGACCTANVKYSTATKRAEHSNQSCQSAVQTFDNTRNAE